MLAGHHSGFAAATEERFLFLGGGEFAEFDSFVELRDSPQAADAYFYC